MVGGSVHLPILRDQLLVTIQILVELIEEKTAHQFPIKLEKSKSNLEENLLFISTNFIDRIHIISNTTPERLITIERATLTYFNEKNCFHSVTKGFEKWIAKGEYFQLYEKGAFLEKEGQDTLFSYEGESAVFISEWSA